VSLESILKSIRKMADAREDTSSEDSSTLDDGTVVDVAALKSVSLTFFLETLTNYLLFLFLT